MQGINFFRFYFCLLIGFCCLTVYAADTFVTVAKSTGGTMGGPQCEPVDNRMSLDAARQELIDQGISVNWARCGAKDGGVLDLGCGVPSPFLNVVEISAEKLSEAEMLGYKLWSEWTNPVFTACPFVSSNSDSQDILVAKSNGLKQCENLFKGLDEMRQDLVKIGVPVGRQYCANSSLEFREYERQCGEDAGKLNVYSIPKSSLDQAVKLGFGQIETPDSIRRVVCPEEVLSSIPVFFVAKYDGSKTCSTERIHQDVMRKELTDAGLDVINTRCGNDGGKKVFDDNCGELTGNLNIYELSYAGFEQAKQMGFRPLNYFPGVFFNDCPISETASLQPQEKDLTSALNITLTGNANDYAKWNRLLGKTVAKGIVKKMAVSMSEDKSQIAVCLEVAQDTPIKRIETLSKKLKKLNKHAVVSTGTTSCSASEALVD